MPGKVRLAVTGAFLAALLFPGGSVVASELKAPKNFVVIFADDFGFGDLGCYNKLFQGDDAYSLGDDFTPPLKGQVSRFKIWQSTDWEIEENKLNGNPKTLQEQPNSCLQDIC